MELTEVRINLCDNRGGRLKAFCSLTFDDTFVIRDVKLIDGNDGLFLAMPSRKLSDHCPGCGEKNHLRARFCNNCGRRLDPERQQQQHGRNGNVKPANGNAIGQGLHGHHNGTVRQKLHADIAHPINARCRKLIEDRVLEAYAREVERSQQPGYVPANLDVEDFEFYDDRPGRTADAPPFKAAQPEPYRPFHNVAHH